VTNLELIETLCGLVEKQNDVIRELSSALEQFRQLTESELFLCESVHKEYSYIIGAEEMVEP
jgi:hypothetical protein